MFISMLATTYFASDLEAHGRMQTNGKGTAD